MARYAIRELTILFSYILSFIWKFCGRGTGRVPLSKASSPPFAIIVVIKINVGKTSKKVSNSLFLLFELKVGIYDKSYIRNSKLFVSLLSHSVWGMRDIGSLKKLELLFPLPGKAIPLKVFGRWGAGKITFFQKGVFPAKQFCNTPFIFLSLTVTGGDGCRFASPQHPETAL